jgi:hypothetical protein
MDVPVSGLPSLKLANAKISKVGYGAIPAWMSPCGENHSYVPVSRQYLTSNLSLIQIDNGK